MPPSEAPRFVSTGSELLGCQVRVGTGLREDLADVEIQKAVARTRAGTNALKYVRHHHRILRKPHVRFFWLDMEALAVRWHSPPKPQRVLSLGDLESVTPGIDSYFWKDPARAALGIELLTTRRKYRIELNNREEWRLWMRGLLYGLKKSNMRKSRRGSATDDFMKRIWDEADTDKSGAIDLSEVISLLKRQSVAADVIYVEHLFNLLDECGSRVLEYDEFRILLSTLLTHECILKHFDDFKTPATGTMSEESLRGFLHEIQRNSPGCTEMFVGVAYALREPFLKAGALTDLGFSAMMLGEDNSILHPAKAQLHQDMKLPLSHYWIKSSTLSNLIGDGLPSFCIVAQIGYLLRTSHRYIEIFCSDGPDGNPRVFAGPSYTSCVGLERILTTMKEVAFQHTPYPVILSLAIRCSFEQTIKVGEMLKESLGDQIYYRRAGTAPLPSPSDLKRKFIIRVRIPTSESGAAQTEDGDEANHRMLEEESKMHQMIGDSRRACAISAAKYLTFFGHPLPAAGGRLGGRRRSDLTRAIRHAFGDLSAMEGRKFAGFDETRHSHDTCSLSESQCDCLATTHPHHFAKYTQRNLCTVWMAGTEELTCGVNPILSWAYGCQVVAYHSAVEGAQPWLNAGRFIENGNSGYVLKPRFLLDPNGFSIHDETTAQPTEISIKVLEGRQLPRGTADVDGGRRSSRVDPVSPYVAISVHGGTADVQTNVQCARTETVSNNGLNPRWPDPAFTFRVNHAQLAIIIFEVRRRDAVSSEFLGAASFPVAAIRPGLRWVPLCDKMRRPIGWAGILVNVTVKRIV